MVAAIPNYSTGLHLPHELPLLVDFISELEHLVARLLPLELESLRVLDDLLHLLLQQHTSLDAPASRKTPDALLA